MKLSVSVSFDEGGTENLMKARNNLKRCARRGMFRRQSELKLHMLILDNVKNILPVLKAVELLEQTPFEVNFKSLDRSRRDGGDIYWVRAEENEIVNQLRSRFMQLADERGYEYSKAEYKTRVELGNMIIARPDFEVEPFAAKACCISVVKHSQKRDKMLYEELYKRELK